MASTSGASDTSARIADNKHAFWFSDLRIDWTSNAALIHALAPVFLHLERCCVALFFGLYHFHTVSTTQLVSILALHAAAATYAVACLRLKTCVSQALVAVPDVLAYVCELIILAGGLVLIQHPGHQAMEKALLVCYFIDVALLIIPEALRCAFWLVHKVRDRCQSCGRQKQKHRPKQT